ncbi:unnamed protein product [Eretmochelys imbricata]
MEQAEVDSEIEFPVPSKQQGRRRAKSSERKESSSPPLWCIAVILGILCLASLVTARVLGSQRWKFALCPANWFPHGEKCYHFSTEYKPWLESQKACSSHGSRLLQIESKQELNFITPLATSHWIGLLCDKTDRPWMWGNGTAISTDQFAVKKGYVDGDCAVVRGRELFSDDCKDTKHYICELPVHVPESDVSGQDRS